MSNRHTIQSAWSEILETVQALRRAQWATAEILLGLPITDDLTTDERSDLGAILTNRQAA